MFISELKKAIMDINESLDSKEYSKQVIDEIGKNLGPEEMIALLTAKLQQIKAQYQVEGKVDLDDALLRQASDAMSVKQPQSLDDPYEKAKQLIDQFRDRMNEIEQSKKSQVKQLKAVYDMQYAIWNENEKMDQDLKKSIDMTNNVMLKFSGSLSGKLAMEKELCANLKQMSEIYYQNFLIQKSHNLDSFRIQEPSNFTANHWLSYPSQDTIDKCLSQPDFQLRTIFVNTDRDGELYDLKFSFGQEYDDPEMDVDRLQKYEIQPNQVISKLEIWEGSKYIYGIRFIDQAGEEMLMAGAKKDHKYEFEVPSQPIKGIQAGYHTNEKGEIMRGLKFMVQGNFVNITS